MKKRHLKRSVKRKLIKAWAFSKKLSVASLISVATVQTFLPVHAEINEKEVIKLTAQLQHTDLSNSSELNQVAVETYNSVNNATETVEDTKVFVTTPAVVTTPTINNATITVVTKEQSEELQSTEDNNTQTTEEAVASPTPTTESETVKTEDTNAKAEEKADTKDTSSELESNVKKETTQAVESNTDSTDIKASETSKTEEVSKSEKTDTIVSTENSTAKAEATSLPTAQFATPASEAQILPTSSNSDAIDLDNVESKEVVKTGSMSLILSAESVEIDSSSDFSPEDYIMELKETGDMLPVLTIDNPVNVDKDGEYVVTYKVTDITGESISKALNVTVRTTEEMLKQRKEDTAKNIQAFVDETTGKHIDEDGYYGDQCWDLWGYFNRVKGLTDFDESCSPYGYVYGIPLKYKTSGASKYYKYISSGESLKVGDWLFWNKGSSYKDSHVALLLGINEDGTLKCLTQSYGQGTRVLDLQPDIMAAFRLKNSYEWWNLN